MEKEHSHFISDQPSTYLIQVRGILDPSWSDWLDGMTVSLRSSTEPPTTTLRGTVIDQAALQGLLNKLWGLNLALISVTRVENETKGGFYV